MIVCDICQATQALTLDKRRNVPVLMHNLYDSEEAATACAKGDVELLRCLKCGFAWNNTFDSALMKYDPAYDNCQTH